VNGNAEWHFKRHSGRSIGEVDVESEGEEGARSARSDKRKNSVIKSDLNSTIE
jgi:hypothetical protein